MSESYFWREASQGNVCTFNLPINRISSYFVEDVKTLNN